MRVRNKVCHVYITYINTIKIRALFRNLQIYEHIFVLQDLSLCSPCHTEI
jgi:hypothetical protein